MGASESAGNSSSTESEGTGRLTIMVDEQCASVADVVPVPSRTQTKISAHDSKIQKVQTKLIRLQNKLEAAHGKSHESKSVANLNMLIRKTNRELAMLKMKKYDVRQSIA